MRNTSNTEEKQRTINKLIKSRYVLKPFIAILIGGFVGFLYYKFAGCSSGNCPVTGNPYVSVQWGGMMGLFIINSPCRNCK